MGAFEATGLAFVDGRDFQSHTVLVLKNHPNDQIISPIDLGEAKFNNVYNLQF